MSNYDYEEDYRDEAFSAAELELINEAEKGLAAANVQVADVDPDADLEELAKEETVDEAETETAEAVVETAPEPVVDNYYKWNVVDKAGVVISSHRTRQRARDAKLPGQKVEKITESSGVTILESPKAEMIDIPAKTFDVETAAPPADAKIDVTPKGESKKAAAIRIFLECNASGPAKRADVLARFMEEIGLSKAGGSTYYANIKLAKKGWTE